MREQIEGSKAVARAVAACRPQVVCAYPITPQTHIVEQLGTMVKGGRLAPCRFLNVESEFAALSVAIGAAAAGSRAYTATASQGLLYMAEAVYNAAGLGLPIVMTVANRAVGAPINIWNDHSDAMALQDAGWVQLHAASNQEAVDLHVLGFRLAEELSLPVMVCIDGFSLTHAVEEIDLPDQALVDGLLQPAITPRQRLSPDQPSTIGAMVGPDAFTEVRAVAHLRIRRALTAVPRIGLRLGAAVGRAPIGLTRRYRCEGASTVVIAEGSVTGTLLDAVDDLRDEGVPVGALVLTCHRPFPDEEVRAAAGTADRVVVLDRALRTGEGGFLAADVRRALPAAELIDVVAGLGGRPVLRRSLARTLKDAAVGYLDGLHFLDLHEDLVAAEMAAIDAWEQEAGR